MESMFCLAGRRAIVTGARRGIGQAIAVGLARQGAEALALARSADALEETAALAQDAFAPGCVETAMTALGLTQDEYAGWTAQ